MLYSFNTYCDNTCSASCLFLLSVRNGNAVDVFCTGSCLRVSYCTGSCWKEPLCTLSCWYESFCKGSWWADASCTVLVLFLGSFCAASKAGSWWAGELCTGSWWVGAFCTGSWRVDIFCTDGWLAGAACTVCVLFARSFCAASKEAASWNRAEKYSNFVSQ